jgi:nicotinamidase-related amidase
MGRKFSFVPSLTALLAIDMQRDFFADDACVEMRSVIPQVATLLTIARDLGCRVIHTREGYSPDLSDVSSFRRSLGYVGRPGPLGRFLVRGQRGHDFVDEVRPLSTETVVDKAGFSAFHNSELDGLLRASSIDHLILCGVTTQCCVQSTLRQAVDLGYWCLTVADACAASDQSLHEAALSMIAGEDHLFGWICDVSCIQTAALHDKGQDKPRGASKRTNKASPSDG